MAQAEYAPATPTMTGMKDEDDGGDEDDDRARRYSRTRRRVGMPGWRAPVTSSGDTLPVANTARQHLDQIGSGIR